MKEFLPCQWGVDLARQFITHVRFQKAVPLKLAQCLWLKSRHRTENNKSKEIDMQKQKEKKQQIWLNQEVSWQNKNH